MKTTSYVNIIFLEQKSFFKKNYLLYLVELWEELGDKYYLISPINDLAVRVSFAEGRREAGSSPDPEGVEGRSGVCGLCDGTVVPSLGILVLI